MAQKFIAIAALTDVGSVRQYNEDSIAIDPKSAAMVVADGMGGHRAGEVASRIATEVIFNELKSYIAEFVNAASQHSPRLAIEQSIKRANKSVYEAAQANTAYQGMGTTVAVAVFYDNAVALGHIGDSRIYRLRGRALKLLTRDDSLLRDQVELGIIAAADAGESHNRSLVTRALGIEQDISPHIHEVQAQPGDMTPRTSASILPPMAAPTAPTWKQDAKPVAPPVTPDVKPEGGETPTEGGKE